MDSPSSSFLTRPLDLRYTVLTAVATSALVWSALSWWQLRSRSGGDSIYKLIYTVPSSHLGATKEAIFAAGGGTYDRGRYARTTFESAGVGVFTPDPATAKPHLGQVGIEERVDEVRVEVRCEGLRAARDAVAALLAAHPYESVGYEVFRAEDDLMRLGAK